MSAAATLAGPWRGLSRAVWILVVARAVNRIGAFTLPFLGVVLVVEFGASLGEAGLILAVFGAATVPSRLLGGQLADRLGRRRTIVLGLTSCAVAQAWIALSSTLWSVVLATVLLGLAFEIYEPPSQATIADVTEPADRPAAYGLLGAAMAAAGVLAGLLAAAVSHWDLRWLFVADAITCLACAVLVAVALPADVRRDGGQTPPVAVWRDRRLLLLLAGGTVFATIYMQVIIGLPLTLLEQGLPESGTGFILAVSAASLILAQRFLRVQSLDDFRSIAIGYGLLAAGLVVTAFAQNMTVFLLATVLWSVGELFLLTRYLTQASGLAPGHGRGRYLAVFGLSWGIATTVAPLTVTQLLQYAGPEGLWLSSAAAAVTLAVLQPWFRRRLAPAGP
ncbi:major facilitator superfamily MFS_1 [Kribbella flavida DSM 17836]|uniref:Major facilitator superfamily MFS_1 n=1 Tax=Kribbella flavida (strain DSM 17836 / JCM 10339 / NBRC 14399) TaxID=479435 RepID=D2PL84_KRIFD|nr:MFS transporter [Kribbella flavida]ADB34339.1 major facilitator superfamily MFS_1 [Kribbella flavida DSM 17836]